MSDYYTFAKAILQVPNDQDLRPDGEWPHYDFDSDTWTFPAVYPGELSAVDDQRLAIRVCELVPTLTVEHWSELDEEQRVPWLEQATRTDKPNSDKQLSLDARALASFIEHPDWTKKQIAERLGCNEKSLTPKRCPKLDAAMRAHKAMPSNLRRGSKDANGNLEAWEPDQG